MYTGVLVHDLYSNGLWMAWNAFLGLIPLLLAQHLFHPNTRYGPLWGFVFVIFVLFVPNAPYIFTDIIHLQTAVAEIESTKVLFAVSVQFLLFLLIGYWLFVESYRKFERFMVQYLGLQKRFMVRVVAFSTMSVGVYLGRFVRLNSWDVFTNPRIVLESLTVLHSKHAVLFVVTFTLFLWLLFSIRGILARRVT